MQKYGICIAFLLSITARCWGGESGACEARVGNIFGLRGYGWVYICIEIRI